MMTRAAAVVLALSVIVGTALGGEIEQRRLDIGLKIFPRLVAVDNDLSNKTTPQGEALLVFVYQDNETGARSAARRIENEVANIAGFPPAARAVSIRSLGDLDVRPAGIFVTEHLDDSEFEAVSRFAEQRQALLFSPLTGDVERGATAGLFIGSRIRPYFNLTSLRDSGIQINKRLLGISKHYE